MYVIPVGDVNNSVVSNSFNITAAVILCFAP